MSNLPTPPTVLCNAKGGTSSESCVFLPEHLSPHSWALRETKTCHFCRLTILWHGGAWRHARSDGSMALLCFIEDSKLNEMTEATPCTCDDAFPSSVDPRCRTYGYL